MRYHCTTFAVSKRYVCVTVAASARMVNADRQAVDLAPTAIPTWSTLGTIFSHTGEHARALHCYEKAAKFLVGKGENRAGLSVQWCAELYFNLGTSLEFAGQTGKAEEAFDAKNFDEAVALFEKTRNIDPDHDTFNRQILLKQIKALSRSGDHDAAIARHHSSKSVPLQIEILTRNAC